MGFLTDDSVPPVCYTR